MREQLEAGTLILFDPEGNGPFKHSIKITDCIGEGGTGIIYTGMDDSGILWVIKESFPNTDNSVFSGASVCRNADGTIELHTDNKKHDLVTEINRIMENENEVALNLQNDMTNGIMNMPFYSGILNGAVIQRPLENKPSSCNQVFSRMQYIKGVTADKKTFSDTLDKLRAVEDIIGSIARIHNAGYILGDIKPQNVMIADGDNGRCFVLDYGTALKTDADGKAIIDPLAYPCSSGYAAPELFDPADNTYLTKSYDVYSLGALIMDLLMPKRTKTIREIQYRKRTEFPYHFLLKDLQEYGAFSKLSIQQELPVSPALADQLSGILQKCLADDREDRYEDACSLLTDYSVFLNNYQYRTVRPQEYNYHLFWQASYDCLADRLNNAVEGRIKSINDDGIPKERPEWWKLEPVMGYDADGICYPDAVSIANILETDDVYLYAVKGNGKTLKACQIMQRHLWNLPVLYIDLNYLSSEQDLDGDMPVNVILYPAIRSCLGYLEHPEQFIRKMKTEGDRFLIVLDNINNIGLTIRHKILNGIADMQSEFNGAKILLIGLHETIEDDVLDCSVRKIRLGMIDSQETELLKVPFFFMRQKEIKHNRPELILDTSNEVRFLESYMEDYLNITFKAETVLMEISMMMTNRLVYRRFISKPDLEKMLKKDFSQADQAKIIDDLINKYGLLIPLSYKQGFIRRDLWSKDIQDLDLPWIGEVGEFVFTYDIVQDYFTAKKISMLIKQAVYNDSLKVIPAVKTYIWDYNVVKMLLELLSQQELDKLYCLINDIDSKDTSYDGMIRSFVGYYWYCENHTLNKWVELGIKHGDDLSKEINATDPLIKETAGSRRASMEYMIKWLEKRIQEQDIRDSVYSPMEEKYIK